MGQKDYGEAGSGHILDLGLDLEYLHIAGAERQAGCALTPPSMKEQGESYGNNPPGSPPPAGLPSEPCAATAAATDTDGGEGAPAYSKNTHQPLCRTPCVDLGPEAEGKEYQAKLEFALKLGYSEETVRLVLSKLGPDTLINDILGELVKLGTKSNSEQSGVALTSTSSSSSSSSSCGCSDLTDGQRSDSPCLSDSVCDQDNLRPIVVDGSNVAMSVLLSGYQAGCGLVPGARSSESVPARYQEILRRLEKEKILVFTPSRRVQGRRVVCYDDRFIVKLAYESDGIIVSNDNYRDLANEKPEWKKFIDERLLMYSFVNDKFMPPDDPLGRHGPSLENFLRKRPVVPEQKKQPCPYGKKCTYGHKCKYYHPERGAQPQRAVADELRASAKTCALPKNQGEAGLVKSHSVPAGSTETKKGAPKRQSDPSIRALSYSDAEEKLLAKSRAESQKSSVCGSGSSSNSSTSCGGGLSVSPAPPSSLILPQDQPRAAPLLPAPSHDLYPHCESPDLSYCSVARAYSGLSLSSRRSPDCRYANDADLRLGSAGSECGSESSVSCGSSCDSYTERSCPACPPDAVLEEHFANPHSRIYPHHVTMSHEGCGLHPAEYLQHSHAPGSGAHAYHMTAACMQSFSHDQPPPEAPPKRPLYPLPPHLQHQPLASRSSCPGDYHSLHQPHPPGSPLGRCLAPRAESVSDSHLYEHLSAPPHRHRPKTLPSWDTYYRQPSLPPSRYEPSTFQSLPDTRQSPWHTPPWSQDSYARSHLEVYINLCNIFPSELVSRVMARSPHATDAQQLAAAILAEKSQTGY
uniref:C3H1-type domain-containing protein n=1 Tax=Oryzias latipes TaxID=8090 RepID=A0A3B3HED5_ORYLA